MLYLYRRSPNIENKQLLKQYSKRLKRVVHLTQKSQNSHTINSAENKTKATWKLINRCKLNFPPEPVKQILIGDKQINDPKDIAMAFNDYFIDSVHPATKFDNGNAISHINHHPKTLFMAPTDAMEIFNTINSLKNTNSTGFDEISTKILKLVAHVIAPVLSFIINLCIECGHFPSILKTTIIKPLHKKGDKTNLSNYRPIALIPVLSKIFEKVIYTSLNSFFEKNHILAKEQYGFRKNRNIDNAINDLVTKIISNVDKKNPIAAVLMDMSKAFDHVDHTILLGKIERYGVRGNILSLIKSYLYGRKQITVLNRICPNSKIEVAHKSSIRYTTRGVPQGSVLGPLLFLIFINDLPKCTHYQTVLFADDSTLIVPCSDLQSYENEINKSIHNIIHWLNNNKLKINLEKTQIMMFQQRTKKLNLNIKYNDQKILETDSARFLGLHLDSHLNWKCHIETVCKKLNQYSYALHNLAKICNEAVVLIAYKAYIPSLLRFGIMYWGNSTDKELAFKAQKKCIRSMFKLKTTDSCKPLFNKYKLLTLPCMYIYETAVFVRLNLHLFQTLRSKRRNDICAIPHRTKLYSKSFLGMGPKLYNKLPITIKDVGSIQHFKKALLNLLVAKTYYTVNEFLEDVF